MEKSYIVHDCDTGADDAVALMMLLGQSDVVPVGITCVEGNTHLKNVVMNNLRLLKLYDSLEKVPVFAGCESPLVPISLPVYAQHVHGTDGLGGQPDFYPPASTDLLTHLKKEHAVNALIRLSKEYCGHLKIVATGPLTNLAMAVRLDPELPSRISEVYIMGGTSHGKGNTTPAAEYNFLYDPEAVYITLQSFTKVCNVFLITYEYTLDNLLPFAQVDEWLNVKNSEKASFAKMMLTPFYNWSKEKKKKRGMSVCDAYAMAIALDPTIGKNPCTKKVCIELSGHHSRGHLVTDHFNLTDHFFNVTCFEAFDGEKYFQMLKNSIKTE